MPHASRMTCVRKFQADRALRKMSRLVQNGAKNCCTGRAWLRNLGFCAKPALAFELSQVKDAPRSGGIAFYICSTLYCDFGSAMRIALSPSKLVPVWHILLAWHQEKHFCRAFPWRHMGETDILYPNYSSGIASLFILRNTIPYFAKVWRQFSSAGVGSTSSHRVLAVRRQWRIFTRTRTRTRLVWDSRWTRMPKEAQTLHSNLGCAIDPICRKQKYDIF